MPAEQYRSSGFDKLARVYRWMEYLTFGPLLWRTRVTFLSELSGAERALVLGDGDGRFTAALLREAPALCVDAVDASAAMLRSVVRRAAAQGDARRVCAHEADACARLPPGTWDIVCSHFFLDCLTDDQCRALALCVAARVEPGGRWIVSEFAVPGDLLRWPAKTLIRLLYFAFGALTGLDVKALPDYGAALHAAGFRLLRVRTRLGGILRAEEWKYLPAGVPSADCGASADARASNHP